jgi:hypothetical protein
MHSALSIEDIVFLIVHELDPGCERDHSALVALACTCRTLSEAALDVIWEEPSLWRLAKQMDARIWEVNIVRGRTDIGAIMFNDFWRILVTICTSLCAPPVVNKR